jgi:multidrug resistance efflux pump
MLTEVSELRELMLTERPHSRWVFAFLGALVLVSILSFIVQVPITAPASGMVRPEGGVLPIQAAVAGVLSTLRVREGAVVTPGQIIMTLDARALLIQLNQARETLAAKRRERIDASEGRDRARKAYEAEKAAQEISCQQGELELKRAREARDRSVRQAKAHLATADAQVKAARERIQDHENAIKELELLVGEGLRSQLQNSADRLSLAVERAGLDPVLQQREEALLACDPDDVPVEAAEAELSHRRALLQALNVEFELHDAEAAARISQAEGAASAAAEEVEAIELQIRECEIRSSVDGVVTQVLVIGPGQVLANGATVANVAPLSSSTGLLVEAYVANKDRGNLRIGLPARITFDALPKGEFGALEGQLGTIAPDSTPPPGGQGAASSDPSFKTTIPLKTLALTSPAGRWGRVEMGMVAHVEIETERVPFVVFVFPEMRGILGGRY